MQTHYYRTMCRWMLLSGALFAASCATKENPAAKCSTGTCTNPAAPFCDVDGTVGGTPGTCLGVTCTPGDFKACRGDVALTCNSNGNNYDELQCQKGCTPEAMGCKLCDAGQTTCTNGEVQTCDANGAVTSSETCPLGCFESEPRCRQLDPSNGFATYLDMVPDPPDVDVTSSGQFDTGAGTLKVNAMPVDVPNFFVTAPTGGSAVRVFVVHDFHIAQNTSVYTIDSTSADGFTGTALAIVATGTITIDGELDVQGPGARADAACVGHPGHATDNGTQVQVGGSGGGGFATAGGGGMGPANGSAPGGAGGGTIGNATLVPLRGGCPAGGVTNDNGPFSTYGTVSGGAVQLSAGRAIVVNGTLLLDGGTGYPEQITALGSSAYGGGSGGAILLEAPTVALGSEAKLLARGGGGDASGEVPGPYANDANPIPGVACSVQSMYCGNGGNGAAPGIDAQPGGIAQYTNNPSIRYMNGGGGGGGLGRVRINTQTGTYTKASSAVEAAALTTGTVGTR